LFRRIIHHSGCVGQPLLAVLDNFGTEFVCVENSWTAKSGCPTKPNPMLSIWILHGQLRAASLSFARAAQVREASE
jgi:hypothetical protein